MLSLLGYHAGHNVEIERHRYAEIHTNPDPIFLSVTLVPVSIASGRSS